MVGEGLFQPAVMLPSQFFGALRNRVPQEAEYQLIVAVLQDAIECFQKHLFDQDDKGRELFEDAQMWIASDDRRWPFSFQNICAILGINPDYLRRGLEKWQERQSAVHRGAKVLQFERPAVEGAVTSVASLPRRVRADQPYGQGA